MDLSLESLLLGVLIGAVGAFGTGFLKKAGEDVFSTFRSRYWPKPTSETQLVVHLGSVQAGALQDSSNLHLAPASVERISQVTFQEIELAITSAPPMQRDRVAEGYVGLRVEWDCYFRGGEMYQNDKISVLLSLDERYVGRSIRCVVPAKEYRELGILPEHARVRVSGEISKARSFEVELSEVRLHVLPTSS